MVMFRLIFMFVLEQNIDAGAGNTFAGITGHFELIAVKVETFKLCAKVVFVDPKIDKGGEIHIAADTGEAIVIENSHRKISEPGL